MARFAVSIFVFFLVGSGILVGQESLQGLIQLNAKGFFGEGATIKGDRVSILYNKPGRFDQGFQGTGLVNSATGGRRGGPKGDKETVVMIRGGGEWQSKFRLSGTVTMSFDLFVQSIDRRSRLDIAMSKTSRSFAMTRFFQSAVVKGGGKTRQAKAPAKYLAPPEKWLGNDKKALHVEMKVHEGKFTVKLGKEVVLSIDGADSDSPGQIVFSFSNLSFSLKNFRLAGNIDRAWCEAQLKVLARTGDLVRPVPAPPGSDGTGKSRKITLKREGDDKATRLKEAEEDL